MKKEEDQNKKSNIDAFNDSAVLNSDEALMKICFATIIRDIIVERGFEEDKASEVLKISRSEAAALLKGKFSDFSLGYLLALLDELGIYIEFVTHEIPPGESPKGLRISTSF